MPAITLEFPPAAMARLTALRAKTQAKDRGEVIAHALRIYEALIESHENGHAVFVAGKDGVELFPVFWP